MNNQSEPQPAKKLTVKKTSIRVLNSNAENRFVGPTDDCYRNAGPTAECSNTH